MSSEPTPRSIRASDQDWARWKQAADYHGIALSAWLRMIANREARAVLREAKRDGEK